MAAIENPRIRISEIGSEGGMPACKARIVVLAALFSEGKAAGRALRIPVKAGRPLAQRGELAVAIVGLRARNLAAIEGRLEVKGIVMAGMAGALDPRLEVGDVVVDGWAGDSLELPTGVRIFYGRVHTAQGIVGTAKEKHEIFEKTGALAVDMESEMVRAMAVRRGIPFLAVRAISDSAGDAIDPAVLKLIDSVGRPRVVRSAMHVMAHPQKLPGMMRLARNSGCALSRLAVVIDAVVASNWPGGK